MFPIGVGEQYDQTELSMLTGPYSQQNIIKLRSTDDLLAMVTLDHSFPDKLCRGKTLQYELQQYSDNYVMMMMMITLTIMFLSWSSWGLCG